MSSRGRWRWGALFAAGLLGVAAACGLQVTGADLNAPGADAGSSGGDDGSSMDVASGDTSSGGDDGSSTGNDGSTQDASGDDVSVADVALDGGFLDVALDADAATCPTGQYACGPLCVTDCAPCPLGTMGCKIGNVCVNTCKVSCGANTVACFECNGGTPVSSCQPPGSATCLAAGGANYTHCGCNGVSPCPGETMCLGKPNKTACFSCGENGTDNKTCGASTGTCNQGMKKCN